MQLFLIVSTEFKFHFVNENNNVVTTIPMGCLGLVNYAHFNDAAGTIITGGVAGVFIVDFSYKSKYTPKIAAGIDKKGEHIDISLDLVAPISVASTLIWCKGLNIDHKNGVIISWSQGASGSVVYVGFNRLSNGALISVMKDLIDTDEQILDVLVFAEYRYFLTATDEGNIYVWKYVQDGKVHATKRLIHAFQGHAKEIRMIMPFKQYPHLFLSASLDGTVRIWSLETFQHLYTLEIPGTLLFCKIFNNSEIIVSQSHEHVQVHRLHLIL